MIRTLLLFLTMFMVFSCAKLEPVEVETYYDVDSLVNAQYEALKLTTYPIIKKTRVNGDLDSVSITPDSTQWEYELGVFRKANINNPTLRGEYKVTREEIDGGRSVTYLPTEPEKRNVKYLELRFSGEDLMEMHARIQDENPVYGSARNLSMFFEGSGKNNRLAEYQVNGVQKMILKDTVTLEVNSIIRYD